MNLLRLLDSKYISVSQIMADIEKSIFYGNEEITSKINQLNDLNDPVKFINPDESIALTESGRVYLLEDLSVLEWPRIKHISINNNQGVAIGMNNNWIKFDSNLKLINYGELDSELSEFNIIKVVHNFYVYILTESGQLYKYSSNFYIGELLMSDVKDITYNYDEQLLYIMNETLLALNESCNEFIDKYSKTHLTAMSEDGKSFLNIHGELYSYDDEYKGYTEYCNGSETPIMIAGINNMYYVESNDIYKVNSTDESKLDYFVAIKIEKNNKSDIVNISATNNGVLVRYI